MPSFSNRLKELRKQKQLSQKALGELIGLSERGIQNYELSTNKPTSDVLIKLADFFHVSVDYLLGRENYWQDSNENTKYPADIIKK